ncbi:MAG: glycosyltransferase [Gemmataceae bacterium]|nr:glycosyltransferase [Gemmata sp.]MDW8196355.1 glycosyltransferase [Gemmataceae bacterium]
MSAATAPRSSHPHLRLARHPVRVCFMIDRLSRAGTETQLVALIRELDRTEVEPSLVLLDGEDDLSRALEPADCPVLRLGVRKLLSWPTVTAAQRLRRFWHDYPPDILQVYFLDSAYFAAPLAKWCGIPKVIRVQNNLGYWLTPRHRVLNRLLRPFVDVIVTNSQEGKRSLLATDRLSPERVVVLENGVDIGRFRRFMLPDTSKKLVRVGCVANLRAVKNIDGLMHAAQQALAQHPQLVFEVAGDGEQREALESLHARLGLGERFLLHGLVADVPGFLRRLDIAVLPSHSEGMSNALLEYMAAGRAVIATDVGANRQLLDDGRCGLLVPPGHPAAIAAAITELLTDPVRAAALGAAARRRVQELYSREAMCRRFQQFYRALIDDELTIN